MRLALAFAAALFAAAAWAQPPADEQLRFADGLFARGFYADAAREYRGFIEREPAGSDAATARYRLGESEYALSNYEAALAAFSAVANPGEGGAPRKAALRQGELLYRLGRHGEAAAALERVAAHDDAETRPGALYYLGKARFDAEGYPGSREALETLIAAYPDHALTPYASYQLGFVHLALDEPAAAASAFTRAGESAADDAVRAESRFRAAEAYSAAGLTLDAVAAYDALQSAFPGTEYAERASYGAAYGYFRAENYSEAIVRARRFLDSQPASPQAPALRFLLANALEKSGDAAGAAAEYRAVRDGENAGEYRARAQYALAWAAYRAGDLAAARIEAERARTEFSGTANGADAAFLLGQIEQAEGAHDAALARYGEAVSANPPGVFAADARFKEAETLALLGRYEEAAKGFQGFLADHPEHPLAAEARIRSADARFLTADFAAAVADLEAILAGSADPAVVEQTRYRLALAHYNGGDKRKAAAEFERLLKDAPDGPFSVEVRVRLAEYLADEGGAPDRALGLFDAALKAEPEGSLAGRARRGLGIARFQAGDFDGAAEALQALAEAKTGAPLTASLYAWLGQYWIDKGAYDKAAAALEELVANHPAYPGREDAEFALADAYARGGNEAKARELFRILHESGKGEPALRAAYRLGRLLAGEGDGGEAIPLLEAATAITADDTGAQARFALGEIRERREDWNGAVREFLLVGILYQHDELTGEALWRAAMAYEKLGQREKAVDVLRELTAAYEGHKRAPESAAQLADWGA